ncbi:MAG: HAD family phosphatase [Pseudomonadota bacterium]
MAIGAVIFDIGNVLIEWQPERHYDKVVGETRRKKLFEDVDLHAMNDLVDRGHNFRETIHDWAERHPDWRAEILLWHDQWIEMAQPAIPHSVRLLRALRDQKIPVFALSNFGVQTFDYAATVYPFLEEFDRRYVSGHLQQVKPHSDIYKSVETDCGLDPDTLLFTDDRTDNIEAARDRGWQTHLFTSPQSWADRLVAEGLLTSEQAA